MLCSMLKSGPHIYLSNTSKPPIPEMKSSQASEFIAHIMNFVSLIQHFKISDQH